MKKSKQIFHDNAQKCHCPFCRGKKLRIITQIEDRSIYKCLDCNFISAASDIVNGEYSEKLKDKLNSIEYRKKVDDWFKAYLLEKEFFLPRFKKRLFDIEKRKTPGKILDIGSAAGFFLELAVKQGWKVYGLDTSEKMVKHCASKFASSNFFYGNLKDAKYAYEFFDVITIFDTLEHIPDLSVFLYEVKRILKQNGIVAICVPNQQSLISKILGKHWFDYKRFEHLYFFNNKTLNMILKTSGFRIIHKRNEYLYSYPTSTVFNKLKRYYPNRIITSISRIFDRATRAIGIDAIPLPLEHIYVIAEKKK